MKHRTINSNGRRDLIAFHQFWHKRRDRWHFVGERNAQQKRKKDDMPHLNVPTHNQKTQRDRENDLHNLRCNQDLAFVPFISERPCCWSERKRRQAGGKINQTKQNRHVGEPAHDPALGHHLHPRAAVGNERADDVTAKRALPQKRERFASNPFFLLFHREHSSLERRLCQTRGALFLVLTLAERLPCPRDADYHDADTYLGRFNRL